MNITARIESDRRLINLHLNRILKFGVVVPKRLAAAMRYGVLSPGKRIRPILALETYLACGGKRRDWILPFCCGLELIHCFSLIHDDLPALDNDNYRRGQPTVHRKFDEATAIIAGDALLAKAFEVFALSRAPDERKIRAIHAISSAIGPSGMAGGQILDIDQFSGMDYFRIAKLKTAEFFAVALTTGAIIAGVSAKQEKRLFKLGIDLGTLFQLTDDLLDYATDRGSDSSVRRNTKLTLNQLQLEAQKLAKSTEMRFRQLGPEFDFFAQLTELILKRQQ